MTFKYFQSKLSSISKENVFHCQGFRAKMTPEGSVSPHMQDSSPLFYAHLLLLLLFLQFGPTKELCFMRSLVNI